MLYDSQYMKNLPESKIPKIFMEWLPRSGRLLNVGCGPFMEAKQMTKMGLDIYGCDISKHATKKVGRHKVKICDARERIPYRDDYFDVVYCVQVLEHLGNTGRFFSEIARVMKKDGVLLMSTPLLGYWKYRLNILFGKDIFDDFHCRYFTIESIKAELEKVGLMLTDYDVSGRLKCIRKSLCGHIFLKGVKLKYVKSVPK